MSSASRRCRPSPRPTPRTRPRTAAPASRPTATATATRARAATARPAAGRATASAPKTRRRSRSRPETQTPEARVWGAVAYRPPHHLGSCPSDEAAQDRSDAGDRDEGQNRGAEAALAHHPGHERAAGEPDEQRRSERQREEQLPA